MPRNYVIAVGGTGARCAEAMIYLAAAGVFQEPLEMLLIDSDQNNGNVVRTRGLIETYAALNRAGQPRMPIRKNLFGAAFGKLPPPMLFQAPINEAGDGAGASMWHDPNEGHRTFAELIQYSSQPPLFRRFLDVFYDDDDLAMALNIGYRGRPSIGAVALKQDLERTRMTDPALRRFFSRLEEDLRDGEARIFVLGSVFGGTGAAGLPTIPALIDKLPEDVLALQNRSRIRYGCTMLTPYFSYPSARNGDRSLDSARHAAATQAALLNYARVQLPYHHVYTVGAPDRRETNAEHAPGGESQINRSHYAELVAALSAWDFFTIPAIGGGARELHYADSIHDGRDAGVRWETLPVPMHRQGSRIELRKKMVTLATAAYFYRNFLHHGFVDRLDFKEASWYANFESAPLEREAPTLVCFNEFCDRYLNWLMQLEASIDPNGTERRLFNEEALPMADPHASAQWLGNLMAGGLSSPVYINDPYNQLYVRLSKLRLQSADTDSAAGLFMYLLGEASRDFSEANYRLK